MSYFRGNSSASTINIVFSAAMKVWICIAFGKLRELYRSYTQRQKLVNQIQGLTNSGLTQNNVNSIAPFQIPFDREDIFFLIINKTPQVSRPIQDNYSAVAILFLRKPEEMNAVCAISIGLFFITCLL